MSVTELFPAPPKAAPPNRYRLPDIERPGLAQLSLLETALWPLQGGPLPAAAFHTVFPYSTAAGRKKAQVTVRAPLGLQPIDEYVLWGMLGATLRFKDADPVLLATPYWMLRNLGWETGGYQYHELRDALLRLAVASYQNTAFYNPESREHEYTAFQFLSILLPTVGGVGETVDNDRSWRIEWNSAFFRFCKATGGNLLFDLDLYRGLSPASRRLFLKLKDRFWRDQRVHLNVDDLTVNGLGFSRARPLKKRKFDLKNCMRELLARDIITLGRGQTDPEDLFIRRGKGCYVAVFYPGAYFRQPESSRVVRQKNAILDDPLFQPLTAIGVDRPAIRRLLKQYGRSVIERWVRITEAAVHEHPQGFLGFKQSAAAYLIDGVQNNRTPPDWFHTHEKRQQYRQWREQNAGSTAIDVATAAAYQAARLQALTAYLASAEGQRLYAEAYGPYLALYTKTDPHTAAAAARTAARQRVERVGFTFPDMADWILQQHRDGARTESR